MDNLHLQKYMYMLSEWLCKSCGDYLLVLNKHHLSRDNNNMKELIILETD